MNAIHYAFVAVLSLGLWACSEPDERVMGSTEDGAFVLILQAEENRVQAGESLPVQVRLERLSGRGTEEVDEDIKFVVNKGSLSPSSLSVDLAGADTLGQGAEHVFIGWVTFTAGAPLSEDSRGNVTGVSAQDQGEIHALFRDVQTTLKIRIVTPSLSL